MRLWRHIRRVLWVMSITSLLILATVECLYRAALTRLPLLPSSVSGMTVPTVLMRATWEEEGSAVLRVRSLMPWVAY